MLTMGELQGFWARPCSTIEYVSWSHNASNGASVNSTTIPAPSDIAENNLLLAYITHEGDRTSTPAASGWTLYSRNNYNACVATTLYKWASASEPVDYTFAHTDSAYGGMGGAILNFSGSIKKGHLPIYRASGLAPASYSGNTDQTWDTDTLNIDIPGAIAVVTGAVLRDPIGAYGMQLFIETGNGYTDISSAHSIGGYSSATDNSVGGGVGYKKFADTVGVALDGGGTMSGDVGPTTGVMVWFSQILMLI
jgi:hypothetical protein